MVVKRSNPIVPRCVLLGKYACGTDRIIGPLPYHATGGTRLMPSGQPSALDASVLVLNKLFMAIHIISVRRAFCLLSKDLAEVVSLEDGQYATYDFETWREVSEFRLRNFR